MALHRFFLTAPFSGGVLPLTPADIRHASLVARLRVGEELAVVEPSGREWIVRATQVSRSVIVAECVREIERSHPRLPKVVLVQAVGKGEKMDVVVRMATELGVTAIVPVLTARTIVKLDARKRAQRAERWRAVAAEASKQAQRVEVPAVEEPVRLADLPQRPAGAAHTLVAWESAEGAPGIRAVIERLKPAEGDAVAIVVGPEGGFTAEEVAGLEAQGAVPVSLGPTILRTETAGVAATALLLHELGGMGNSGA